MLTDQELLALVGDEESDRVERKESASNMDRIGEAVCAFANDLPAYGLPGVVFIGVTNKGNPTGLQITDELLTKLGGIRSDGNVLPPPVLAVRTLNFKGKPVAVMEVEPSRDPPVRFKGSTWIRVGPRRGTATREEERRLTERRLAGERTFDRRPCYGAALDELLEESFRNEYLPRSVAPDILELNERTPEEQLASSGFFDLRTGKPTHAGILVFGRDPLSYLPGAFIQFARFDGESLADPIKDQKEIGGNLMTQLRRLDDLLPLQVITSRVPGEGLRFEDVPDYPQPAIREFVMNAVMHRTYEGTSTPVRINWFLDRVEILSPGGLYGQVTPVNYERVSDYRNPVIAVVMKVLGYVERFGTGIARAKAALARNGNPPPEFVFEPTHVLVIVRRLT